LHVREAIVTSAFPGGVTWRTGGHGEPRNEDDILSLSVSVQLPTGYGPE